MGRLILILFLFMPTSVFTTSMDPLLYQVKCQHLEFTEDVYITGYSSRECETDDTPLETATMDSVRIGCIALSRDLIEKYGYYNYVLVPGFNRPFLILDTMHSRFKNCADIWWPKTSLAYNFGRKRLTITIIVPNQDEVNELYLRNKRLPIKRTEKRCEVLATHWSGHRG